MWTRDIEVDIVPTCRELGTINASSLIETIFQ